MSERTTKSMVLAQVDRLMKMLGGHWAKSFRDVGGWELDYNAIYGGYVIHTIYNEAGAVDAPFGDIRRNAREMYDTIYFAMRVLKYEEKSQ